MPTRRQFLEMTPAALSVLASSGVPSAAAQGPAPSVRPAGGSRLLARGRPLAITMWDFSWLERRWPGAGYEDWNVALDELAARGYDAVRIDAYPHLVASIRARDVGHPAVLEPAGLGRLGARARHGAARVERLHPGVRRPRARGRPLDVVPRGPRRATGCG